MRVVNYIKRNIKKLVRKGKLSQLGIEYVDGNFLYQKILDSESVVVDSGCGYEVDFSQYLIKNYDCNCYAIDPTKKHFESIAEVCRKYNGKLNHLRSAISSDDGEMMFHEPINRESGSISTDHNNMKLDEYNSYKVETIAIKSLKKVIGKNIDLLKLDLEGAEFEIFKDFEFETLLDFKQIFIEFHHHAIALVTQEDTYKIVKQIDEVGFSSYSLDDHNYLFIRNE
tara:strand:- start:18 stop:695 length:678 start_codon:yes stop_codon:yes gene_type:complete